jgi:ABC-type antimicrobial peptide transport system permease subunit
MIKNYLKIAWRNIRKHTFHSLLNITGLSIGIAFSLLIAGYVWGELNVNKGLKNINDQYILQSNWKDPDMGLAITTLGPLAKTLKAEYPSLVADYYRWDGVTSNVSNGDKVFREGLQIGDSSFLNMYGFTLMHGDRRSALAQPFSVVITANRAMKYFGRTDVVGKTVSIESFSGSKHDFKITAVMQDPAYNSVNRITFDNDNQFFIPVVSAAYFSRSLDDWDNPNIVGLLELQKGVKASDLQQPMKQILKKYANAVFAVNMQPYLAPLKDYYLEQNKGLARKMIFTVSLIAFFILLMAIINFINISIGKSSTRIKEIGVRKVLGGQKKQIVLQFVSESVLLVFFSTLLALLIYILANPFISDVLGTPIPKLSAFPVYFFLFPFTLVFVIGFLAGIYPAFVLSALKTVDSVKGKLQSVNSNIFMRKTLVGFQFCAAAVVIIGAIILAKQVDLFFSKDLGYDKEYVVSVQLPRDWSDAGVRHMQSIRDEFERLPEVSAACLTWSVPEGIGSGNMQLYPGGKDSTQSLPFESLIADEKYLETFKIPLAAGRNFRQPADSLNVMINQTAVKLLGLKNADDAIGKRLFESAGMPLTVIGVTNDFHFGSMKDKIRPLVITHVNFNKVYRLLCFKLKPGNMMASLDNIHKKWLALMPGSSFEYKFMDESLQKLYKSEIQLKKATQVATVLVLVIVILGIIGLVSLSIQKRTKEIGIRKILGSSVNGIILLFLKEFLSIILFAGIIACPLAYWMMQKWLNDYAYRIELTWYPFTLSIGLLVLLTALLIGLQTIRAAVANPSESLRTE